MKRDYLRMFVKLAKKHGVWFAVLGDGYVDYITDTVHGNDYPPVGFVKFGSKAAYDWLVECIKKEGE